MLAYHCAFGLEDKHVENLVVDQLGNQPYEEQNECTTNALNKTNC
jgi:hypothetical protein